MNTWSRDAISDVLNTIVGTLADEANTIAPDFPTETIHRFRVETKRLRALLRLLEAQDASAELKLGKDFRTLYRLSGAVRDAQVLLNRATTDCDPPLPDYTVWLAQQMANAETEFTEFYDSKTLKKLRKRAEKLEVPAVTVETLRSFFQVRLEETETLLRHEPIEDEDLHTVRKRVKDLQHIAKICGEAWPEGIEALGEMASSEAINAIADLAGDYNDQSVALASLDAYLETADKTKKPEKVREKWAARKDTDREALLTAIADFREAATAGDAKKDPAKPVSD